MQKKGRKGFHNGLKHLCSLKLVSILRATLWKVVMKCKIVMFSNFLGSSFLRLQNFISPNIKYPINLIFSVVVCICEIHVFNGVIPRQIMQNFWIMFHDQFLNHPYLMDFFEIFTSGRYREDMKALKILASNYKHFRIYGIFKKWQIGAPRLTFQILLFLS